IVDIKKPPGLLVREASQRGRACPYVRKPPRGMIMVASTTLSVSTVRACYNENPGSTQHGVTHRHADCSDAPDQIALDALACEHDDGVQRVPTQPLLHL